MSLGPHKRLVEKVRSTLKTRKSIFENDFLTRCLPAFVFSNFRVFVIPLCAFGNCKVVLQMFKIERANYQA